MAENALPTDLYTLEETAALLRVPPKTLRSWRTEQRKGPPSFRLAGRVMYRKDDLERWIADSYRKTLVGAEEVR